MPKGVEHVTLKPLVVVIELVLQPLMPKGVEHSKENWDYYNGLDSSSTSDAERR